MPAAMRRRARPAALSSTTTQSRRRHRRPPPRPPGTDRAPACRRGHVARAEDPPADQARSSPAAANFARHLLMRRNCDATRYGSPSAATARQRLGRPAWRHAFAASAATTGLQRSGQPAGSARPSRASNTGCMSDQRMPRKRRAPRPRSSGQPSAVRSSASDHGVEARLAVDQHAVAIEDDQRSGRAAMAQLRSAASAGRQPHRAVADALRAGRPPAKLHRPGRGRARPHQPGQRRDEAGIAVLRRRPEIARHAQSSRPARGIRHPARPAFPNARRRRRSARPARPPCRAPPARSPPRWTGSEPFLRRGAGLVADHVVQPGMPSCRTTAGHGLLDLELVGVAALHDRLRQPVRGEQHAQPDAGRQLGPRLHPGARRTMRGGGRDKGRIGMTSSTAW